MTEEIIPVPTPGMFDILPMPNDVGSLPPPEPFYYVAGPDGYWVHKKTRFGRVLHKLAGTLGHLPKQEATLWPDIPKLPAGFLGQIWSFFKQVYEELGTEAMVYLTYKDGQYRAFVPRQQNTGGHVNAKLDIEHIADGWTVIGDIHSHCNFSAFHSGTDTGDAAKSDGLHITIGNVLHNQADWDVMISLGGVNWSFKLPDITVNGEQPNLVAHPQWWHRYVEKETPQNRWQSSGTSGAWTSHTGYSGYRPSQTPSPSSTSIPSYNSSDGKGQVKRVFDQNRKDFAGIELDDILTYYEELEDQLNGVLIEMEALGLDIDLRYYIKASNIDVEMLARNGLLDHGPIVPTLWRGDDGEPEDFDSMEAIVARIEAKNIGDLSDADWALLQEYYDLNPLAGDRLPAPTTGAN